MDLPELVSAILSGDLLTARQSWLVVAQEPLHRGPPGVAYMQTVKDRAAADQHELRVRHRPCGASVSIACIVAAGSIVSVSGSMSTKCGTPRSNRIEFAEAMNENGDVMTASPSFTPAEIIATCIRAARKG